MRQEREREFIQEKREIRETIKQDLKQQYSQEVNNAKDEIFMLKSRWEEVQNKRLDIQIGDMDIVIKYDGLAGGKGVFLPNDQEEAQLIVYNIFQRKVFDKTPKATNTSASNKDTSAHTEQKTTSEGNSEEMPSGRTRRRRSAIS